MNFGKKMDKKEEKEEEVTKCNCKEGKMQDEKSCHCDCDHDSGECCCNSFDNESEEKIQKLTLLVSDLENKVKYHQAELINYRRRKDEEVSNMLKYANQDLIMELIPILDNFERAMKLSNTEDPKEKQFLEGFKMLYSHMAETLKKFGVEEIEALDQKFDPNLHQALLIDKDETKEDEVVLEVLLKGYTLKGKMIRPSSVKVNKLN